MGEGQGEGEMKLTSLARVMRKNMTDAERKLWRRLRGNGLGYRFRRQAPVGPHILDFVCFEKRVAVEVDGGQHVNNAGDAPRDAWLREQGFAVLRFWNADVLKNLDGVLNAIVEALDAPPPLSSPIKGEETTSKLRRTRMLE